MIRHFWTAAPEEIGAPAMTDAQSRIERVLRLQPIFEAALNAENGKKTEVVGCEFLCTAVRISVCRWMNCNSFSAAPIKKPRRLQLKAASAGANE